MIDFAEGPLDLEDWVSMRCDHCGQKAWIQIAQLLKVHDTILCLNCLIKLKHLDNLRW